MGWGGAEYIILGVWVPATSVGSKGWEGAKEYVILGFWGTHHLCEGKGQGGEGNEGEQGDKGELGWGEKGKQVNEGGEGYVILGFRVPTTCGARGKGQRARRVRGSKRWGGVGVRE